MNSSASSELKILRREIVFNRLIIVVQLLDQNKTQRYLEIFYGDESPNLTLVQAFKADLQSSQDVVLQVLEDWESVLQIVSPTAPPLRTELCAAVTKKLVDWVESEDFQKIWRQNVAQRRSSQKDYEQIKYHLTYLLALYSEDPDDIWPFVRQITASNGKVDQPGDESNKEDQVLSVLYKDKKRQEIKERIFEDEKEYEKAIIWFRERLNLVEAQRLILQRKRYRRAIKKRVKVLLRDARKFRSRPQESNYIVSALKIDPQNRKVRRLATKRQLLRSDQEDKRAVSETLSPVVFQVFIMALFVAVLLFYAIPKLIFLIQNIKVTSINFPNIVHLSAFPQLLFMAIYGIVLGYVLYSSLIRPLMPKALRNFLLFTFVNSLIPLVVTDIWVKTLQLSNNLLGFGIAFAAFIVGIIVFRETYQKTREQIRSAREAAKRTFLVLCLVFGQELTYAIIFSDLVGRSTISNAAHSDLNAQKLMNDYVFGVIPKLIVVPPLNDFGIHLFPSIILLWCFSSLALGAVQEGIFSLFQSGEAKDS